MFRYRQSQPSHAFSSSASLTLFVIICQVPTLPELLSMDDQKALLCQGTWSSMAYVNCSKCELSAQALLLLSQSKWPALMQLNVSQTSLGAEGMVMLAKGNWPLLKQTQLSYNPTLDAAAIAQLSTTSWPLTTLSVSRIPVSAATAAELAQLHLPNLNRLFLDKMGLTAASMSELARADWPMMQCLSFSDNDLDAAGRQHLCKICLPALNKLHLSQANISESVEGAHWPFQGAWPLLTDLNLSHNQLHANAIESTVSAIWLELQLLWLAEIAFGHDGLQQLIKAKWPLLQCMSTDLNRLERCDSCLLLGLDSHKLQILKHKCRERSCRMVLGRDVSHTRTSLSPNSKAITIFRCFLQR